MNTLVTIGTLPCPSHKIKHLAKDSVAELKKYISNKSWNKKLKDFLTSDEFIKQNHVAYVHYPMLFNEVFEVYDKEILTKLSMAGFFCFNSVNMLDDLFDTPNFGERFDSYYIANILNEEAIKLLSSIFAIDSEFWNLWHRKQEEMDEAYQMNRFSEEKIKTIQDYEILAEKKSTYAKAAIDALYVLSTLKNKEKIYNCLLNSHKHFSILLQISDDFKDIIPDIENQQFNILNFHLREKNIEGWSAPQIKTELYKNGAISKYSLFGVSQATKSLEHVTQWSLDYWKYMVQTISNKLIMNHLNQSGFIKEFETKSKLNNSHATIKSNTFELAIDEGLVFLFEEQESDGSWQDYFNNTGVSDTRATAFVLATIPSARSSEKYNRQIHNALNFLEAQKQPDKGWGYNSFWMPDADSTTLSLLAFTKFKNGTIDKNIFNRWQHYQTLDGGITTYNDKTALQISIASPSADVSGWQQSHLCVSATAYYFLAKHNYNSKSLSNLKKYIINCFEANTVHSYWWTHNIYVLYFLLKGSYLLGDKKIADLCNKYMIKNYLSKEKLPSTIINSNFYSALLLSSICTSKVLITSFTLKAKELSTMLLRRQKIDGSWEGGYALRIPSPDILNPTSKDINWKKDNKGVNVIFEDFHRLFSTASCVEALAIFHQST